MNSHGSMLVRDRVTPSQRGSEKYGLSSPFHIISFSLLKFILWE